MHQRHHQHLRLGRHRVSSYAVSLEDVANGGTNGRHDDVLAQRVHQFPSNIEATGHLMQVQKLYFTANDQRLDRSRNDHPDQRSCFRGIVRGTALLQRNIPQIRLLRV